MDASCRDFSHDEWRNQAHVGASGCKQLLSVEEKLSAKMQRGLSSRVGRMRVLVTNSVCASGPASSFWQRCSWLALRGRSYQLQFTTSLTSPNWTNSGSPITATNTTMSASDTFSSDPQRFYRLALLP